MSRQARIPQKHFVVFCEGDTEYNYIKSMNLKAGVSITLKPINMKGGGYSNFLKKIKVDSQLNCLAKFIIIDGDRILENIGEQKAFKELLEYCISQNKRGKVAHFLIVNNPRFEYVACLHFKEYKNQDIDYFLTRVFNISSIEQFKSNKEIYEALNSNSASYLNLLERTKQVSKIVNNEYSVKKKEYNIEVKNTIYSEEKLPHKCTNIGEFFDVIDW